MPQSREQTVAYSAYREWYSTPALHTDPQHMLRSLTVGLQFTYEHDSLDRTRKTPPPLNTQFPPGGSIHAVPLPWQRRPAAYAPITTARSQPTRQSPRRSQPADQSERRCHGDQQRGRPTAWGAVAGACRAGEHTGLVGVGIARPVHPLAVVAEVTWRTEPLGAQLAWEAETGGVTRCHAQRSGRRMKEFEGSGVFLVFSHCQKHTLES